ncbi:MAG: hypothetical protein JSW22_01170 [Chloroflexota bacterium]|nr:MAG: hypothetical protein JSW22_01170 [Chloroflexota bacterium]
MSLFDKILLLKMRGVNSKMLEVKSVYFPEPGSVNTEKTLKIAKRRAEELGIKSVVIASTSGETGLKALKMFTNYRVVVVTHAAGFPTADVQELTQSSKSEILEKRGMLLTATHAFGGVGRAVRRRFNTYQVDEIIAHTLRVFGQGTKVACEIALMAADAGLIRTDEEIISIGGTGSGADTALVIKPAHTHDFFQLQVQEILCKPR